MHFQCRGLGAEYIPREESNQETRPGEEERASIFVEWIQDRDGTSFLVDRIDLWCLPQVGSFESQTHFEGVGDVGC